MKKTTTATLVPQVRCSLYARTVTETQGGDGIAEQLAALRERASQLGWTVADEYTDRAVSGATMKREGLARLLEDAKAGKFSIVLVDGLDRLSRDQLDLHYILQSMEFHDVRIYTIADGRFLDKMRMTFRGFQHQVFLNDLAFRVRRGQQGAIRAGRCIGRPSYGYRTLWTGTPPKSTWEIDPEQAEIVRRIFREYAAGKTVHEIADDLNAEKIPYPISNRRAWNPAHVLGSSKAMRGIIRNPIYRGVYVWGKTKYCRSPDDGRRISTATAENERTIHECPHLRIVEDALWVAVQDRLAGSSAGCASACAAQKTRSRRIHMK